MKVIKSGERIRYVLLWHTLMQVAYVGEFRFLEDMISNVRSTWGNMHLKFSFVNS